MHVGWRWKHVLPCRAKAVSVRRAGLATSVFPGLDAGADERSGGVFTPEFEPPRGRFIPYVFLKTASLCSMERFKEEKVITTSIDVVGNAICQRIQASQCYFMRITCK